MPGRFKIFAVLLGAAALAVLIRYGYLMLGAQVVRSQSSRSSLAGRGPILDRNGRFLAQETRLANIGLWRPDVRDPVDLADKLGPILEIPPAEILERIRSSESSFLYLKKQVDESTLKMIETVQREDRIAGINIEPVVGRIYPEGRLAAQIIGFVGTENSGLGGVEYSFDRDLAPQAETVQTSMSQGSAVYLTLDINVQHILENIAEQVLTENKAEAVMLLALDPSTGDILGAASLPGFDPNRIQDSPQTALMNRPAAWAYEPGSVFKVFSMAALLDSRAVSVNSVFTCNGYYERVTPRGERIRINCLGVHGRVTPQEILIHSCNAGAAYASDRQEGEAFYSELKAFGFGAKTESGNPGETAGLLQEPGRWSARSKPTIAMGQEIAVSALQMLQAASVIANDGVLVPPRVVSKVVSSDGKVTREYRPSEGRRVIRAETARAVRSYMEEVTSAVGTGWRARLGDISLAVKTGTAQMRDQKSGGYSETDFIASCLALVPAEAPSLALYLVIVKPAGESYLGGRIAAPPIRQAAEELIGYLGIPRGRNPQIEHPGTVTLETGRELPAISPDAPMPDLRGFPKRSLLPLLLREDFTLEIAGEGWVVRQWPAPGETVVPGAVIRLELE